MDKVISLGGLWQGFSIVNHPANMQSEGFMAEGDSLL